MIYFIFQIDAAIDIFSLCSIYDLIFLIFIYVLTSVFFFFKCLRTNYSARWGPLESVPELYHRCDMYSDIMYYLSACSDIMSGAEWYVWVFSVTHPQLASAPQRVWSHLTLAFVSCHYCAFSVACSLLAALATTGLPQGVSTKPESVSVTSTDAFK